MKLWPWSKFEEFENRIKDLERHFVVKPATGTTPAETLADIPYKERKERKELRQRGLSWPQRQKVLEMTEGGRKMG